MLRTFALALLLLCMTSVVQAEALSPREGARIEFLIQAIASLENAQFIRNGSAYGAEAAASHLRLKLGKAGSAVKSAEDFIRYCGTSSSMSGKAYEIRFDDGRVVPSATFLHQRLVEYDAAHPQGTTRAAK